MTTIKRVDMALLLYGVIFLGFTSSGFSQHTSDHKITPNTQAIVKISGISPSVGASFKLGSKSKLRVLGFFSTNFQDYGLNNQYFLGISYLRYGKWLVPKSLTSYWGVDLSLFDDKGLISALGLIIAPGLVVGTSYSLSDHFAIFGEAGLNALLYENGVDESVGMFNSGVGIKLAL